MENSGPEQDNMSWKKPIKTQKRWAFLFYEQLNIDKEQIESIRGEWLEFYKKRIDWV